MESRVTANCAQQGLASSSGSVSLGNIMGKASATPFITRYSSPCSLVMARLLVSGSIFV